MKIAIIDVLGLSYDGSTLNKRGLGGSESAVILISKELVKLGFEVTVFNDCVNNKDTFPGTYDGVVYKPLSEVENDCNHDVIIASRSVAAYAPAEIRNQFKTFIAMPNFDKIVANAKHKVLWMHDTFCDGDILIEQFLLEGRINEVFTLSDFHTDYVTNCDHGKKRMFEILKDKVFQTRNGIVKYHDWVDVRQKDPDLFVYNASVTKGMIPLVEKIWPRVKQQIPNAKLTIVGGFYKFRDEHGPDEQEKTHTELQRKYENQLGIHFTGVIKQSEIADLLCKTSFMIYPGAFPETFGISTLEALAYNTPIIACEFGALEETAFDLASYKIPYPIEPNGLFPWINTDDQVNRFVDLVIRAYNDKYLHQQKMYACNQIKDICGWDTVALQWKQHLFKVTGEFLPVDQYREVSKINYQIHKVFGRRFNNNEELQEPRSDIQQKIVVITPVFNAENYIRKCILSVAQQDYSNYQMYVIDDCSTDNTKKVVEDTIEELGLTNIQLVSNTDNMGAVYNQVVNINDFCISTDIVMMLDGDDWLINDPNIFHKYNNLYHDGAEFTYGSCWSLVDNIPLIAQPYPPEVKQAKGYRDYKFSWNMPYTHLRTFRKKLIEKIDYKEFKDADGNWLRAGGDTSIFYSVLEEADPNHVVCVPEIVCNYNDLNPLNDYKINGTEQTKNANTVLSKKTTATQVEVKSVPVTKAKKKILIAVPSRKDIEAQTFKSIYDLEVPEGYETDFQFFYGYAVSQVRNLIAHWTINAYDYLFAVDHDMSFEPDTLKKLLSHDKDVVSGLYRQRMEPQIIEMYDLNYQHMPYEQLQNKGLVHVGACGFGCVLVKKQVFEAVGYPYFVYHEAIDHRNTFSEDLDFCKKANDRGFSLWADTSILCGHYGEQIFRIEPPKQAPMLIQETSEMIRLRELSNMRLLPPEHINYLHKLKADGFEPKVIYDLGSCVLHWTREAKQAWPGARFVLFEAMSAVKFLYDENGFKDYSLCVLSDRDGKVVEFFENTENPGGNSYYRENPQLSPNAVQLYSDDRMVKKIAMTIDTIVDFNNFPMPDLIKMDIQGAELDVLKGAFNVLQKCNNIILELQYVDYNMGSPKADEVIWYMENLGFECKGKFSGSEIDGDYYFERKE